MCPLQPANSRMDYVTTAGNVTHITFCAKTGEGSKSAQKTMSQKNHSWNPLSLTVMPWLYMSRAQIAWSRCLFTLVPLVTLLLKALDLLTTPLICNQNGKRRP
jgi:hypothetical protein